MNKFFYPTISLIAAIGLYFLYISPLWEEITLLQEKEVEFDQTLENVKEVEDIITRLESSYVNIPTGDLLRLQTFLPSEINTPRLVQNINGIASSYGVEIRNIDVSLMNANTSTNNGEDDLLYNTHIISFSFLTTYDVFISLLDDIERNLQIANVTKLDIFSSLDQVGFGQGLTKHTIELTLYSYKD